MRVGDELLVSRCACSDVRLVRGVGRRRGSAVAVGRQDRSLMSTTGAATGDPANGIGVGAEVDDLFNGTVETVCLMCCKYLWCCVISALEQALFTLRR